MPDQALVLERKTVKGTVSPDQKQHLKENAKIPDTRKEDWLYDPGFKQLPLAFLVSLDYFLRFSRYFVQALLKTAEFETLFKRRTKRHTAVAEVIEKSDMTPQKVRNILYNLVKKGKLERVSRGIYQWGRPAMP